MDESKVDIIKVIAEDDAAWDKSFVDLNTLGYVSNKQFTTYDPPKDPEAKTVYDQAWNEAKKKR